MTGLGRRRRSAVDAAALATDEFATEPGVSSLVLEGKSGSVVVVVGMKRRRVMRRSLSLGPADVGCSWRLATGGVRRTRCCKAMTRSFVAEYCCCCIVHMATVVAVTVRCCCSIRRSFDCYSHVRLHQTSRESPASHTGRGKGEQPWRLRQEPLHSNTARHGHCHPAVEHTCNRRSRIWGA